jgi:hypothetical protein
MTKKITGGWEWPWSSNTKTVEQPTIAEKPTIVEQPTIEKNPTIAEQPAQTTTEYILSFFKSKPQTQQPSNQLGGKRKTKKAKKSKKSRTSKAKK